jgi:hypothetical protein
MLRKRGSSNLQGMPPEGQPRMRCEFDSQLAKAVSVVRGVLSFRAGRKLAKESRENGRWLHEPA